MNKSIDNIFSPENERKEFSKRLIIALENCGLPSSPTVFCKLLQNNNSNLHLTTHAVRKWLNGESIPTQEKLRLISEILRVKPEWLRFGDERISSNLNNSSNNFKIKFFNEYEQLNSIQQKYIFEIMKSLASKNKKII